MKVKDLKKEILSFGKFDFITKFQTEMNKSLDENKKIILLKADNENPIFLIKKPNNK